MRVEGGQPGRIGGRGAEPEVAIGAHEDGPVPVKESGMNVHQPRPPAAQVV